MLKWTKDKNKIYVNNKSHELSYPIEGNSYCFQIEDNSPWFNQRNDLIRALIKKNNLKGNFLDIGGGNGFQIEKIDEINSINKTYIIEPGYTGCMNAKKRGVKNIYCGFFQDFDWKNQKIDICGLFDVIEHIEDDIKFLNELYDKMDNNTHVIINVPSLKLLWSDVDVYSGHYLRYNKNDIKRISLKTNFKVLDSGYYFNFYFLPLFILRVLPYRFGLKKYSNKKDPNKRIIKELKNHSKKNSIFQKMINKRHEFWIKNIYRNKYPLFGTSIFMVLKKTI